MNVVATAPSYPRIDRHIALQVAFRAADTTTSQTGSRVQLPPPAPDNSLTWLRAAPSRQARALFLGTDFLRARLSAAQPARGGSMGLCGGASASASSVQSRVRDWS